MSKVGEADRIKYGSKHQRLNWTLLSDTKNKFNNCRQND